MFWRFKGISAPVFLDGCDDFPSSIAPYMRGWEMTPLAGESDLSPAISLYRRPNGHRIFSTDLPEGKEYNSLCNTMCAFFGDLMTGYVEDHPGVLALHCGAVKIDGRLVLFLGRAKAGKSTLCTSLVAAGGCLYSDDVLPLSAESDRGIAFGMAPRLRRPVPSRSLEVFVEGRENLINQYYCYVRLKEEELAPFGEETPVAAIMLLDRQEKTVLPGISPIREGEILKILLQQNFGALIPGAEVVSRLHRLAQRVPCVALRYDRGEEAVAAIGDFVAGLETVPCP